MIKVFDRAKIITRQFDTSMIRKEHPFINEIDERVFRISRTGTIEGKPRELTITIEFVVEILVPAKESIHTDFLDGIGDNDRFVVFLPVFESLCSNIGKGFGEFDGFSH